MALETEFRVIVHSEEAVRQIEKASDAAKKLRERLDALNDIEINISVKPVVKKWWKIF